MLALALPITMSAAREAGLNPVAGLWMTLVAYVAMLFVAVPYWALVGEPIVPR